MLQSKQNYPENRQMMLGRCQIIGQVGSYKLGALAYTFTIFLILILRRQLQKIPTFRHHLVV
jgi:hypothetical protein